MVTFLTHCVQLALILKHSIQIASHFIGDSADSLMNTVCLISVLKVTNIRTAIDIKRALKFVNYMPRHRVHTLNLLWVLPELRTQFVQLA